MPVPKFQYSPGMNETPEQQLKNLRNAYVEMVGDLNFLLQNLDQDNVLRAKRAIIAEVLAGTITTNQIVAGSAKISQALIEDLTVDRLTASDGSNKVYISSDGSIYFTSILYGINGSNAVALFPQPGMVKCTVLQAWSDQASYSAPSGMLALGKIENLVCNTNAQVGNGGPGSGIISIGYLTVTGTKNSLQKTANYGERLINAYETAGYFFGDIGSAIIGDEGEVVVHIDEIFQECVNTNIAYYVFTQICKGSISRIDKQPSYFTVKGEPGAEFDWEIKAKRRGYEADRMEIFDAGDKVVLSDIESELNIIIDLENTLLEV